MKILFLIALLVSCSGKPSNSRRTKNYPQNDNLIAEVNSGESGIIEEGTSSEVGADYQVEEKESSTVSSNHQLNCEYTSEGEAVYCGVYDPSSKQKVNLEKYYYFVSELNITAAQSTTTIDLDSNHSYHYKIEYPVVSTSSFSQSIMKLELRSSSGNALKLTTVAKKVDKFR